MGIESVKGVTKSVAVSFTRPADTTTYTAGDIASNSTSLPVVLTFNDVLKDNCGSIQHAMLLDSANQTTLLDSELWLFTTAPAATNDNSAVAFTDAELAFLVGIIDFAVADGKVGLATSGAGGNSVNVQASLGIPIKSPTVSNTLYGVLVVRNAYIPVSGEIFTITLGMVY